MLLAEFDYNLPKELIAQYPAEKRDGSRLMTVDRASGAFVFGVFKDIVDFIKPGDLLVLNNTRVIKARITGRRKTGGKADIFLLEKTGGDEYRALLRPYNKIKAGDLIDLERDGIRAEVIGGDGGFSRVRFIGGDNIDAKLEDLGQVPLPPYIKRMPSEYDEERYQTVYASLPGATAAPTAGLHFTRDLLNRIKAKGAAVTELTLHVSYGTFAPVKTQEVGNHRMHSESFALPEDCAKAVNRTKDNGGRVIAVGTTAARTLEACAVEADGGYRIAAKAGDTGLFIYPPYNFKIVDALLTNFHLPKSTLLLLVSAFAGKELIFKAYEEAISRKFRFFSYGDCMLVI